jgi:two-component system nitrate/nitrite response regulator NarL
MKILVAEDDPLTMAGILLLLGQSLHDVVAQVPDGAAVMDQLPVVRPDILILDVDMPERGGIDVLRTLRGRGDERPIILLTGRIGDREAVEALQLGVNGLVIKAAAPRDLLTCLDAVAQGRRWLDQEVLQRAMTILLSDEGDTTDPLLPLSGRERGVAGLVLQGLRNREIAVELGLTEGTVKVYLHKIFEKLGVRSRTELILRAQAQPA